MPRVETVINKPAVPPLDVMASVPPVSVMLRPGEIAIDAATDARPGPVPANEADQIRALAESFRQIGQVVPITVERRGDLYAIHTGRRRRQAALLLDSDEEPFYLQCVVRGGSLRSAIAENLHRRGYNALQFAYLCKAVREENGWSGTKEVAEYLGVSRAQVWKHDQLLRKPDGMDEETYNGLIAEIAAGSINADTALWALTHVKPEDLPVVMSIARNLAEEEQPEAETPLQPWGWMNTGPNGQETPLEAQGAIGGSGSPPEPTLEAPTQPESQEQGVKKSTKGAKTAKVDQRVQKDAQWMKEARKKSAERKAQAKVEKRHIKEAAKKAGAVKQDAEAPKARGRAGQAEHTAMQRTLPELRKLFDALKTSAYPDVMRNFISVLGDQWWRGDASDKEVISHWSQVAVRVEIGEKIDRAKAKKENQASLDLKKKGKKGKNR